MLMKPVYISYVFLFFIDRHVKNKESHIQESYRLIISANGTIFEFAIMLYIKQLAIDLTQ